MPQSTPLPQFPHGTTDPRSPPGISSAGRILRGLTTRESPVASLYIHVPFCFHKCHYCDFYSIVDTQDRQREFTDRLLRELRALALFAARPLETVFIGGGTPSLLAVPLWKELLQCLGTRFDLSKVRAGGGEFTVECNPESSSRELMDTLRAGGVNRVSVGAQSFNSIHLKSLERWHDPANVPRALGHARDAGIARQSLDLIFAVPGQTLREWDEDLRAALAMGTEHLSCYALTYEPQTAMTARMHRGEFPKADEDLEADMFEHTLGTLRAAGLDRYEVSNFAKPGAECRHNLVYWRQGQWLAAGPSASSHVGGHRWKNTTRLDDYLRKEDDGFAVITDHEAPDRARALTERLWTGLRTREGVHEGEIVAGASAIGTAFVDRARLLAATLVREGTLREETDASGRKTWCLSDAGFMIADRIAVRWMRALG